jgi:hypothetical protein
MPIAKKNTAKNKRMKRPGETVVVVESRIAAKDTLFPAKVAKANKILGKTKLPSGI